jgi:uncharacterized protein (DUF1919 family)
MSYASVFHNLLLYSALHVAGNAQLFIDWFTLNIKLCTITIICPNTYLVWINQNVNFFLHKEYNSPFWGMTSTDAW